MMDIKVPYGANSYGQRYYFDQNFSSFPQSTQDELHIICVPYIEDVGGILTMEFNDSGNLEFKVTISEEDYFFGETGNVLKTRQYQEEKRGLPKTLELCYRISFLGEEITLDEGGEEQMKLRIRSILLEDNITLTSMAEATDLLLRLLCREQGTGCVMIEMVSAKAILHNNRNTEELLQIHPQRRSVAVQLLGPDPKIMGEIATRIEDGPYDFIDVNAGCLASKTVSSGEGSTLMKDPKKAGEILIAMVRTAKKSVMVKFRKGFNDNYVNGVEFVRMAESCGVAAVAVHGRTREQHYSGRVDWDTIRWVKETVRTLITGNGDVFTSQNAKRMTGETGCDNLIVARGAKDNLWIFGRINHYPDTGKLLPEPSIEETREMVLHHDRTLVEYRGGSTAMREMQGYTAWYTKGMPHSTTLRNEISQTETLGGLTELLNQGILADTGRKDGNHFWQSSYSLI